jgi:hypothetical protein
MKEYKTIIISTPAGNFSEETTGKGCNKKKKPLIDTHDGLAEMSQVIADGAAAGWTFHSKELITVEAAYSKQQLKNIKTSNFIGEGCNALSKSAGAGSTGFRSTIGHSVKVYYLIFFREVPCEDEMKKEEQKEQRKAEILDALKRAKANNTPE